jgi:hypothetical protein
MIFSRTFSGKTYLAKSGRSETKFTSKEILKAIKSLEKLLGRAVTDSLIADLELYELRLENDRAEYGLAEIKTALEKRFGDASPLLIERVMKALNAPGE